MGILPVNLRDKLLPLRLDIVFKVLLCFKIQFCLIIQLLSFLCLLLDLFTLNFAVRGRSVNRYVFWLMSGSVTEILNSLRQGVDGAATELVTHFLPMLRKRMEEFAKDLRVSDADDIAVNAFYELCKAIENSRFEDVSDRTQLWQVLSMIAIRKANDFRKHEAAEKRGGKLQLHSLDSLKYQVAAIDERPDLQLEMLEQCESLLQSLDDEDLRAVAELKIKGMANAEISRELGIAVRTVQLMVARIKAAIADRYPD